MINLLHELVEEVYDFRDNHLLAHSSESNYSMVFQHDLWEWKSILKPAEFEWTIGTTPMSNFGVVTYSWVCYFTIIMFLKFLVRQSPTGFSIKWFVALHNIVLIIASVTILIASAIPLYELVTSLGFQAWCSPDKVTPRKGLAYWSIYIFYLSKFYELLDTAILVIKKKKISFLHAYHHAIVILVCWLWAEYKVTFALVPVVANSFVHIFMYWHYLMASLGFKVWYKKYLTSLQIFQFVVLGLFCPAFVAVHISRNCNEWFPFGVAMFADITFLFLFLRFYRQTYMEPKIKQE